MTIEINVHDGQVQGWLSTLNKYMDNYEGGSPLVHTLIGYIRNELDSYEQGNNRK